MVRAQGVGSLHIVDDNMNIEKCQKKLPHVFDSISLYRVRCQNEVLNIGCIFPLPSGNLDLLFPIRNICSY